jgi:hypothetical protein
LTLLFGALFKTQDEFSKRFHRGQVSVLKALQKEPLSKLVDGDAIVFKVSLNASHHHVFDQGLNFAGLKAFVRDQWSAFIFDVVYFRVTQVTQSG